MSVNLEKYEKQLAEIVSDLHIQSKAASALKHILRFLDFDPENAMALQLAEIICSGNQRSYKEIQNSYLRLDQRLDSIFNQCCICSKSWVPPGALNEMFGSVVIMNSYGSGGYCSICDKAYCPEHVLDPMPSARGTKTFEQCPVHHSRLDLKAHGREQFKSQPRRRNLILNQVLFIREGPIPPEKELVKDILKETCLDVYEDKPVVIGLNLNTWIEDPEEALSAFINWRKVNQLMRENDQQISIWQFRLVEVKARAYIVKVWSNIPRVTLDNILGETIYHDDFEYRRFILDS